MTRVKICGIFEKEHALVAAKAGADYVGFIFASSPRQITLEKAAGNISAMQRLAKPPLTVGVFVNEKPDEVNRIAGYCRLDLVQLSGIEDPDYCSEIKRPLIKVIHVSPDKTPESINSEMESYLSKLDAGKLTFLLDTHAKTTYGGTGKIFNWDIIKHLPAGIPVFIAGGLTQANVGELVQKYRPWGVDVSSGVETNGKKDAQKIKAFIKAVKR
ncbi:MAG: phosphoribosylanthranilate isomerase [Dehalococcoidales bacterium]|nr:phosphoribosylanthranilate isomerase [Dehalococcoidales bacterium]